MKRQREFYFLTVALLILFNAPLTQADSIRLKLTHDRMTASAGSTITFDATITNLSLSKAVFLNSDSSTTSVPYLVVDDSPFLTNFPLKLGPGNSSGPFALFSVIIDPNTPTGTYDFNSFSILGGFNGNTFDTIGTADFSVTVGTVSPTPEPQSFYLMLSVLLILGSLSRFKNANRIGKR